MSSYLETIKEAGRLFHVHPRDILGRSKFEFLIPARFAVFVALHRRGNSMSLIGRWMNRDHTTVRNGLIRARGMMEKDPAYRAKVEALAAFDWTKEQTT